MGEGENNNRFTKLLDELSGGCSTVGILEMVPWTSNKNQFLKQNFKNLNATIMNHEWSLVLYCTAISIENIN